MWTRSISATTPLWVPKSALVASSLLGQKTQQPKFKGRRGSVLAERYGGGELSGYGSKEAERIREIHPSRP